MTSIFEAAGADLPESGMRQVVSKVAFAQMLGLTPPRISQLIAQGLPLTSAGKIPVDEARAWYEANVAPSRRKALADRPPVGARARLDVLKVEQAQLDLDRSRGELVARKLVNAAVFERARAERDAHLAWIARTAPVLALELGCDPAALFSALDRTFRDHLAELAETPELLP